jgi:hypothetical protein
MEKFEPQSIPQLQLEDVQIPMVLTIQIQLMEPLFYQLITNFNYIQPGVHTLVSNIRQELSFIN